MVFYRILQDFMGICWNLVKIVKNWGGPANYQRRGEEEALKNLH